MLAIFIIILPLSNSQKCSCNEIYIEDLCQEARGCAYDAKSGFCEEIQCIDRMIDDCFYFAGKIRCYWDNKVGFCQELSSCEQFQELAEKDTYKEYCLDINCSWDYQDQICVSKSEQKLCQQYDAKYCLGASQTVGLKTSNCVLNGEQGDVCTAFLNCEDITYKESCDLESCKYEDGECKTKDCKDYTISTCPNYNKISGQQCYPVSDTGCSEFLCEDFAEITDCQNHPRCFWSQDLNQCYQQACDKATYATQCLSFSYVVENAECKWENDNCYSCYSIILYNLLFSYLLS
ncbi:unnamed protein product (macronuclear) [Paramecium tetraurelia]|uniref:Uncharacterized protein n=1 Tax=Paramecium tetraurelia TaxID=5888 RepID=A0CIF4_PARTE|nr:uncharacterized protein GSPATT00007706001 [Paramecium tetraurelia]CAK70571.1 unnamed protein product [Paramecium tetraurelia]|eukprot:XP_001437968.1 hypothetical protein (macronuclear) [Paramecium tetraurelia strain d4-2]